MILCEKVITEFKYILSLKLKGCGKGRETAAGQGHLTACVAGENGFACKLLNTVLSQASGWCWTLSWAFLVTLLSSLKFSGAQ